MPTLQALILVALLGNDSFQIRERAFARLLRYAEYAPAVVLQAERSKIPEIAQRAKIVASRWIKDHAEEIVDAELPDNWTYWPWLGDGEYDDHIFLDPWLDQVPKDVTNREPMWHRWRAAARLHVLELVKIRQPVREMIREMCMSEIRWCLGHGFPPPQEPIWKTP